MRCGHGRIMALVILVLGVNGCSKQEGHLQGIGARGESPSAFVVPACGGMGGGALEFYFTQGPNESVSHRATYIAMKADGDLPQSEENFIIMPGSYILSASRCPLAGECETAIWEPCKSARSGLGKGLPGNTSLVSRMEASKGPLLMPRITSRIRSCFVCRGRMLPIRVEHEKI